MRIARVVFAACAAVIAVPGAAQGPAAVELFARRDKGHCVACHQVAAGAGPQTLADLGPPLEGGRMRALGKPAIRAVIADPLRANPQTVMPPFGRHRILDSSEIDRLVDYVHALPDSSAAAAAPAQEDAAAAAQSHADEVAAVIEAGRNLWNTKFRNGRTLASCFPNGGRRIAATYPLYDTRVKAIVTIEMAINQCRKTHNEPLFDATDPATMGAAVAYVRSLANGQKIAVRVPPAAQAKLEQGKRLHATRMGQRNYACASCHVRGAGKRFEDSLLSAAAAQAPAWPIIRNASAVTAQARMRECLERMGAAPFAAGSDELNQLEYYLTWLANGQPVKANGWRAK